MNRDLGGKFISGHKINAGKKNARGYHHSEESKRRISLGNRGQKRTEEFRKRMSLIKKQTTKRGSEHYMWRGGRHKNVFGYVHIYKPEHPFATNGYILEHRLVMENHLGRLLDRNEMVHHRNGIKDDNRLDNLEIVLRSAHRGVVRCPHCLHNFSIQ